VRGALLGAVLLVVLLGSALNLTLGAAWVGHVAVVGLLRWRLRAAPWLLLAGVIGLGALAFRLELLGPPAPRSYAATELAALLGAGAPVRAEEAVEPRADDRDLERRGALVVGAGRRLAGQGSSPEAGAAEAAVRRLALALTETEPRDRDEVTGALRAAEAAVARLVRALSGAGVSGTVTRSAGWDEAAGVVGAEFRYELAAGAPLGITRVEIAPRPGAGATRQLAVGGATGTVTPDGATLDAPVAWLELRERVVSPARPAAIRPALRTLAFERATLDVAAAPLVIAWVRGTGFSGDVPLAIEVPRGALERVSAPRRAVYFVDRPGTVSTGVEADEWTPADPKAAGPDTITLELAPRTALLRTAPMVTVRPYLYQVNLAAGLALTGLAALTWLLAGRPRRPPAEPVTGGGPGAHHGWADRRPRR
jgi:hypothetical protein